MCFILVAIFITVCVTVAVLHFMKNHGKSFSHSSENVARLLCFTFFDFCPCFLSETDHVEDTAKYLSHKLLL